MLSSSDSMSVKSGTSSSNVDGIPEQIASSLIDAEFVNCHSFDVFCIIAKLILVIGLTSIFIL